MQDLTRGTFTIHGHEDLEEENLVLLFERKGEPVDDRSQDLQQLRHPVVSFSLVHEPVEDVVDLKREEGR